MGLPETIVSSASAEMRKVQAKVLILGHDVSFLSMLANLLTLAGYSVDVLLDADLAIRKACEKNYDLAVVGYSFSDEEQRAFRTELGKYRRALPVLVVAQRQQDPERLLVDVGVAIKKRDAVAGSPAMDQCLGTGSHLQ